MKGRLKHLYHRENVICFITYTAMKTKKNTGVFAYRQSIFGEYHASLRWQWTVDSLC